MKNITSPIKSILFSLFFIALTHLHCFAQESTMETNVLRPFNDYTKIPREVAYVHLNKTVYLKGETLAFTAYILDKNTKTLSSLTTNLYCTVIDETNKVVKQQLIQVENGIGSGQIFVDSVFTSGNYTFKAYTNWMRNFNERNFYSQLIKIIDVENATKTKTRTNKVDVQFLPEGGHLVLDVENSVGVIMKDSLGYGLPNVEGKILNEDNLELTTFKTNVFGFAKFSFVPKPKMAYHAEYTINNTIQDQTIRQAEQNGIVLKITDLGNKIALTLNTNQNTLPTLQDELYQLTIHNGKSIKAVDIVFDQTLQLVKVLDYENLFPGINIITLFDGNHQPLLERQFFKYDGIEFLKAEVITSKIEMDSINVQLQIKGINPAKFNSFSISVLPNGTHSYNPQHNIASNTFLQPYLRGAIEDGHYYFNDIDRKKKYDLDLLLLTQGWSSYDWDDIFSNPPKSNYKFETGITINASINKKETGQYLIYPTRKSKSNLLALDANENSFERTEFFPYEDDNLKIGEILKNGKVENPSLYLQFSPSKIPDFNLAYETIMPRTKTIIDYASVETFKPAWEKVEELNEVVITAAKEATRLEQLKRNSQGNIDIFDDSKRQQYFDIASYLSAKGFRVTNTGASIAIINTSSPTPNNRTPLVYLDKMLLFDFSILLNYQMNNIDYIVIDKSGFGEGVRGSAGVIKIFTDPSLSLYKLYGKSYQEFEIPLTFSEKKRFYAPVYSSFASDFFKQYGVVGWIPNLSTNDSGNLNFNIQNIPMPRFDLYIEGITEDGAMISQKLLLKNN